MRSVGLVSDNERPWHLLATTPVWCHPRMYDWKRWSLYCCKSQRVTAAVFVSSPFRPTRQSRRKHLQVCGAAVVLSVLRSYLALC